MKTIAIVAVSENGIIGVNGRLPWAPIPEDLRRFRDETAGHAVIMGRGTWNSLPTKPLPDRTNIVVTARMLNPHPNGGIFRSVNSAIRRAKYRKYNKLFIIGGENIYREGLPHCTEVLLTRVHETVEYKPEDSVAQFDVDLSEWNIVEEIGWTRDYRASFYRYLRVR